MDKTWTLQELVAEAAARLGSLPPPKNGQVRAVPDERTIRYYAAIGLLDKPAAMRARTALYGARHLAQVVAIKRMQGAGKSLADIQALWPSMDDVTLARMSGVALAAPVLPAAAPARAGARKEFWKREPDPQPQPQPSPSPSLQPRGAYRYPVPPQSMPMPAPTSAPTQAPTSASAQAALPNVVELRIEIAPGAFLTVGVADGVSLTSADVRALRAAAAPLATELANRGLTAHALGTLEKP